MNAPGRTASQSSPSPRSAPRRRLLARAADLAALRLERIRLIMQCY
jgi:hypothetical protein